MIRIVFTYPTYISQEEKSLKIYITYFNARWRVSGLKIFLLLHYNYWL